MPVLGYDKMIELKDEIFETGTYDLSGFQLASYEIRASGHEILVNGQYHVNYQEGIIILPPHQIAFLSTIEIVKMPSNLLGKIVLRFEYASKGLLLLGGHVDPLFEGRLILVVDNLSDRPIVIKPGDRIAILNFFEVGYNKKVSSADRIRFKKLFKSIPHYIIEDWQGRHMIEIYNRIEDHRRDIDQLSRQVNSMNATSQYVIIGGIILISSSILGVVLQTVFASWNSAINIGTLLPQPVTASSVLLLLGMPIITVIIFIVFLLAAFRYFRPKSN